MATTPVKSTDNRMGALSSAKKAALGARQGLENVETTLNALMANESSEPETESTGGLSPSTNKRLVFSPDTNNKENCSSSSKQLKSSGVPKQDTLFFDFDQLNTAGITPTKTKSHDIRNLASKIDDFTQAIKEMNASAGRTPTKHRKNEGKGSCIKSPTYGLLEQEKVPKKLKVRTSFIGGLSTRKELKKCLTPPRKNFVSHIKHHQARTSPAAQVTLSISYNGVNDYRMISTEHDPSLFQVELPAKKEVIVHSKICALMDGYTAIHREFNFAMLSGVSHSTLEKEYERSTDEKPMIAGSCHRDVVQKLLTCANDIVVEGFFREYTDEENDKESERMEACILSSESLRQIIVCFRGSTSNQAKPLVKSSLFRKQASCILDEEQKVPILATFRTAYFGTSLEKTVFALLANLETRKPFFDVVMTGHSFGAAMATIASLRYASSNSQMRVSCHVFGSPRIGGEEWRQLIHSVPNLRIYRAENGSDPYILLPSGNEWIHCGHAIQMGDGSEFKARRFDRDRSATTSKNHNLLEFVQAKVGMAQGSWQGKVDNEIQSYAEKLTSSGDKWFMDFCEVKGKGIRANNERRTLA